MGSLVGRWSWRAICRVPRPYGQRRTATWGTRTAIPGAPLPLLYPASTDPSRQYALSEASFKRAIALTPASVNAHGALALLAHLQGDIRASIGLYHAALSLSPQDPILTVLLEMALREQVEALGPETLEGGEGAEAGVGGAGGGVGVGLRGEGEGRGQMKMGTRRADRTEGGGADGEEEEEEVGEGSTMDIEDD